MFVFVVSAILVQALIGANASCLQRGPGPVVTQELLLNNANLPSLPYYNQEFLLPSSSSNLAALRGPGSVVTQELLLNNANLPSLPYYNQELLLPSPAVSYTKEIDLINYAPNLPLYNQEVIYSQTLPQLPTLPTYTQEIILPSPVQPSPVLPAPGYQYGFNDLQVVGDLPIAGSAAVNGNVPVNGALKFSGNVAANGRVSVSCGCGNYQAGPIYY